MITAGGGGISSSCFTNAQQGSAVLPPPPPMMYGVVAPAAVVNNSSSINEATSSATTTADFITRDDDHHDHDHESSTSSFLYNLSILKDKINQVQSLATMFIISSSNNNNNNNGNNPSAHFSSKSTGMAIANLGTLIQEIIVTASSMMFTSQQLALTLGSTLRNVNDMLHHSSSPSHLPQVNNISDQGFYPDSIDHQQWYGTNDPTYNNTVGTMSSTRDHQHHQILMLPKKVGPHDNNNNNEGMTMMSYDIVELDAADLLAKYTHYCQVCGKGFKRDANLRMHMRAHGDEYKTSAALMSNNNQFKKVEDHEELGFVENNSSKILPRKYSCPQEGCKWNKKHAKFTPLKSMICVKNHYKRSHCPKMYVCKRCNRKEFSVLSDLRTHEKHCGDILKWQCTCGTTFSRKDKLMGHVALFVGHSPAITSLAKMGKTPAAAAAAAHHILQDS